MVSPRQLPSGPARAPRLVSRAPEGYHPGEDTQAEGSAHMHFRVLQVGPLRANCYVLGSEQAGEALIVDPGGDAETILAALEGAGLRARWIVLTHTHFDHVLAAPAVRLATGAALAVGAAEADVLANPPALMRAAAPPGTLQPMEADRLLHQGEMLEVGELTVEVLETPGHSAGGISLYVAAEGLVITGDALFRETVGRSDLPGGDEAQLLGAIRTRLLTLPDDTVVYPGHGPASTIGHEKTHNPWLRTDG